GSHGEKKELIDEVVRLAKKNGITTPYTSYLVVPDNVAPAAPVVNGTPITPVGDPNPNPPVDRVFRSIQLGGTTINSAPSSPAPSINYAPPLSAPQTTTGQNSVGTPYYHAAPQAAAAVAPSGATYAAPSAAPAPLPTGGTAGVTFETTHTNAPGRPTMSRLTVPLPQAGKEGVDFAVQLDALRNESRLGDAASCRAAGRTCLQVSGVWVDEDYKAGMKTVTVKALSKAYFRMLERHPELKEVFQLGRFVVWITPSGTALVIDPSQGEEKMSDKRIDALFAAAK